MSYPEFDSPAIQREYERWVKKLEVSGAATDAGTDTLNWVKFWMRTF